MWGNEQGKMGDPKGGWVTTLGGIRLNTFQRAKGLAGMFRFNAAVVPILKD